MAMDVSKAADGGESASGADWTVTQRPAREEVGALAPAGLVARFGRGVAGFDRRVFELSDAQLDTAFMPEAGVGRWPVRVLLGHLADAELAQAHRMRRVAAEDGPVLSTWDENAFIDAGLYGGAARGPAYPIGGSVATVHTLRTWTAEWLGTIGSGEGNLSGAGCWERAAMHPERGRQTLRDMVVLITWHLEHHAWYLNKKVEKFLGPVVG